MSADDTLVAALLRGDKTVFTSLVERLHPRIVRICRRFVATDGVAEDVAQDTWQAMLQGLAHFEGRSSLDTWIIQIAINRSKTRAVREARTEPTDDEDILASRFSVFGWWKEPPRPWRHDGPSERAVENRQLVQLVRQAIERLPNQQRVVVTLRDIEGMSASEVCDLLDVSQENQRVLLHRGRTRLRCELESAYRDMDDVISVTIRSLE